MSRLQEITINKFNLGQSVKMVKGRIDDCKIISTELLDLKDGEVEKNLKLTKLKIEKVKLFDEFDP